MRLPFLSPKEEAPLRLRLPTLVEATFVVYLRCPVAAPPDAERLRGLSADWAWERAPGSLREGLCAFLRTPPAQSQSLQIHVMADGRALPEEVLAAMRGRGMDEAQERQIQSATHNVLLKSRERLHFPPFGLWATYAAARAIGETFGGLAVDVDRQSALPAAMPDCAGQAWGLFPIRRFLNVHRAVEADGRGVLTTGGMVRYGLPDLQVQDAPPSLFPRLVEIACGLAQQLAAAAMRTGEARKGAGGVLFLPHETILTRSDLEWGWGPGLCPARPDALGRVFLRLALERGRNPKAPPLLTVRPPRAFSAGQEAFVSALVEALYGRTDSAI